MLWLIPDWGGWCCCKLVEADNEEKGAVPVAARAVLDEQVETSISQSALLVTTAEKHEQPAKTEISSEQPDSAEISPSAVQVQYTFPALTGQPPLEPRAVQQESHTPSPFELQPPGPQSTYGSLQMSGAEIKDAEQIVFNGVVDLLSTRTFQSLPPTAPRRYLEWLRDRVVACDKLDPETPMTVVHWSALSSLQRIPRNPQDADYYLKALDVVDEHIRSEQRGGALAFRPVFCMLSHEWSRPDPPDPHPDTEDAGKAKALATYAEAARARNINIYYWLDFAAVSQDSFRDRMIVIAKLPCLFAACTECLVFWSDGYELRAWTRLERLLAYVFSSCETLRAIDDMSETSADVGAASRGIASLARNRASINITDPQAGICTSNADWEHIARLQQVALQFQPVVSRVCQSREVEFDKSKFDVVRMRHAGFLPAR
mmetsp:Transcript_55033/g.128746  ORF Transcript_55033/g.128746 Transcript_55033/m.128746 type:complete len:431 (+) Transcript_55033:78-1370(+)